MLQVTGRMAVIKPTKNCSLPRSCKSLDGREIDGKYWIVELIAQSELSEAYDAREMLTNKQVVLKISKSQILDVGTIEYFNLEAERLGGFQHSNIARVLDSGHFDHRPYLVTEPVRGTSLADRMKVCDDRDVLSTIEIFAQLADALWHLHNFDVVHGEVSLDNIFLDQSSLAEQVMLDIGLSAIGQEHSAEPVVDFNVDIYSFGCSLVKYLTGKSLVPNGKLPSGKFSNSFASLLEKLLYSNPEDRFKNFDEVRQELLYSQRGLSFQSTSVSHLESDAAGSDRRDCRRRRLESYIVVALLCTSALVGLTGYFLSRHTVPTQTYHFRN